LSIRGDMNKILIAMALVFGLASSIQACPLNAKNHGKNDSQTKAQKNQSKSAKTKTIKTPINIIETVKTQETDKP